MMDREKQINEIAKVIERRRMAFRNPNVAFMTTARKTADSIYNADYRKQSEVIDEFVKRLKEEPIKLSLPLFGLSTKDEIEEYFNDILLEVRDAINRVAKEIKGGAGDG